MSETPTPQPGQVTPEQIRVAASVGVQLLSSESTVIPTAHMDAGLVLRSLLAMIAEGQAIIAPVNAPATTEPPPAPGPRKPPGRKKTSKKARKKVKSKG